MNIVCKVQDSSKIPVCLRAMQNSMAKSFALIGEEKSRKAFVSLCENTYNGGYAALPMNQSRAYALKTVNYPFGKSHFLEFGMTYMYSEKETKELRCASAKIAENLLRKLPEKHRSRDCINAVWRYMKSNFTYKLTGSYKDHSAYELLKTRSGVCQAFAALAAMILTFMGVPCLYVRGELLGSGKWVPHGWNCARTDDGKWMHFDVTVSLDMLMLSTTSFCKKAFESCHRYEESLYTDAALDAVYMNNLISAHSEITLDSNDTRFFMYGMEFNLQDGEPLLMNMRGKYGVDVSELYFVLGGATVYDGESDTLMLCLYDCFDYIRGASKYMLGDGYYDVRMLGEVGAYMSAEGNKLKIKL